MIKPCLNHKHSQGFTLLEILLVVAAIGILAGIVIVAVNPAKQLGQTKNAQRKSDVNTILNAVYQYTLDNNGNLPPTITSTSTEICNTGGTCTGLIDLSVLTTDEEYLVAIPRDPSAATVDGSGYYVHQSANGRITVSATNAELEEIISVTR